MPTALGRCAHRKPTVDGIDQKFNLVVLTELANTVRVELYFAVMEDNAWSVIGIKKLRACDLKPSHIKISGSYFDAYLLLGLILRDALLLGVVCAG